VEEIVYGLTQCSNTWVEKFKDYKYAATLLEKVLEYLPDDEQTKKRTSFRRTRPLYFTSGDPDKKKPLHLLKSQLLSFLNPVLF